MAKAVKTPGEVIKAQAAVYNLSITQLAEGIKISPSAARLLINNKLRISVSFAQRLSKFFGKTPKYWIDLQTTHELNALSDDKKEASVLKTISKAVKAPAAKKTAAKTATKKTAAKKSSARGPGRPAKNAAAKPAAKKTAAKKAPAKKVVAKKVAKPRGRKPAPKETSVPVSTPAPTSSIWTPSSEE
jgi:addiction module HigA family antidote